MNNKIKAINAFYPIKRTLELAGVDVDTGSNFICPCHADTNKSAHIYPDSPSKFFCFAERKLYYSIHIIRKFNLNSDKIFEELVEMYGGEEALQTAYDTLNIQESIHKVVRTKQDNFISFSRRYFGK